MRARYLDIAKGFAIICIVTLHFATGFIPFLLNMFIGGFMITMFYVTAGWVDSMKPQLPTIKSLLIKRWHQLGVPYVAWTAIILAFDVLLWGCGHYSSFIVMRDLYKSLVLRGIGTLWFLPALYGAEVLWWYVRRSHRPWVAVVSVVVALVGVWTVDITAHRLNLTGEIAQIVGAPLGTLSSIFQAFIPIAAGFAFGRASSRLRLPERNKWLLAFCGILIVCAGYWLAFYLPWQSLWIMGTPQVTPLGLIIVFMAVETSPLMRYFEYWGRNSLALMVTHFSIVMVMCDILTRWITGSKMRGGWIAVTFLLVTMAVEYFIAEWLRRKHPRLIGIHKKASKRVFNNKC